MECFSANPLYLMIRKIKCHFEGLDGDKYLMIRKIKGHFEEVDGDNHSLVGDNLIISSENGDIMQKYQEVFDGIEETIKKIDDYGQPIKYDDNYMKIKFNT